MKTFACFFALLLCFPEVWSQWTPYDVWAADQIGLGLLLAMCGALLWRRHLALSCVLLIFGFARTGCVAAWPEASDAAGSICDAQTGLPLTVGVLGVLLYTVERLRRG